MASIPVPQNRVASIKAFNAGVKAMQGGDPDTAIAQWQKAYELDSTMMPAVHNLVAYHEEQDHHERSVELYREVLEFDPFDTRAWVRRGTAYKKLGHLDNAIQCYEQAIALYPGFRFWYYELADLFDAKGQQGRATELRDRAAGMDTDAVELAMDDGIRQYRASNYPLACACFEAVIDEAEDNIEAHIYLARTYQALSRHADAVSQLSTALQHAKQLAPRVYYERAVVHAGVGNLTEAQADLETAVDGHPNYGRAKSALAQLDVVVTEAASASSGGRTRRESDTGGAGFNARISSRVKTLNRANSGTRRMSARNRLSGVNIPVIEPPNRNEPWEEQVAHVVRKATTMPGPTGKAPRVAILIEPIHTLKQAASTVIELVSGPELSRLPGGGSPVFVAEGESAKGAGRNGLLRAGWLNTDAYPELDFEGWVPSTDGLPIDRLLETVNEAGGDDGFNVLLVLGSGRVRSDQTSTLRHVRNLLTLQVALVCPKRRSVDLSLRMKGTAPNWTEVNIG